MINCLKYIVVILIASLFAQCSPSVQKEVVSFYEVPLVCSAAPEIGCGSRIKPLFQDMEKESLIQEAWTNREGTILAIRWKDDKEEKAKEDLLNRLFEKHGIEAKYILNKAGRDSLQASLSAQNGKWLKGMAVDSLSLYEAGVIAHTLTDFASEANLITQTEQDKIRAEIEAYFKKELVKVRTENELRSEETQAQWKRDGFTIYVNHLGTERAEAVKKYFDENEIQIMKEEGCCDEEECKDKCDKKELSAESTIVCPKCGYKKREKMPTDVCLITYECEKCKAVLHPKSGDCCVFCTYGDHKCPSKQES